ncbi:MAG: SDR family oxidoreductase [Alphaproteobacteria bacterium]|jgi:nucleoside-diphosphate-sugar epimerase|nr:SDR family oxidoreductase [Alphaproteobacteria bacterium]MBT4085333.1 SDR family oxidoreductase [Alphaproteobacteria bacterium]MBT4544140.1 SDR family oxidoreductase [Alphaproteobacteria bacterium]
MADKKAVVVGGLGVIGRNLINTLNKDPAWDVVGLSRRVPDFKSDAEFISVDLLNRQDAEQKLAGLTDVTHIFYAAFQGRPVWAEHNAPNLAMLVNAVEPIEAASPGLRHVNLVQGNKIYGSHLGPFKTPAREDDPPHMLPNFYWDQQTWLAAQQNGKSWAWSALRPQTVCGFAVGNPMNITTAICAYAAISKELGLPLRFPGKPGAYTAVYQVADAEILNKAMLWCADSDAAANEVFNITNSDFFRWSNVWPRFAKFFDLEVGDVQTISLTDFMADKGPLWASMVKKYGLQDIAWEDLVAWPFADYVFGTDWDVMTDTLKIRQAGFHDSVRSEEMFLRLFQEFRDMKVIP